MKLSRFAWAAALLAIGTLVGQNGEDGMDAHPMSCCVESEAQRGNSGAATTTSSLSLWPLALSCNSLLLTPSVLSLLSFFAPFLWHLFIACAVAADA